MGLGLAVLSYVVLALGSLGLIYTLTGYLVIAGALLVGAPRIPELGWRGIRGLVRLPELASSMSWPERLLVLFIIGSALVNLIGSLAPPTGSDELNYNFALPKLHLESHEVGYVPSHRLSVVPFGMEMLWLLGMMVRSADVAQLLNWSLGLAVASIAGMLAARFHSRTAGLVAASLVYSITVIADLSGGGKPELGGALFLLLSMLALLHWRSSQSGRWLVLAGVFLGAFAGTKLPNPLIVATLVAAVSLYAWRAWGWESALRAGATLGLIAALIFGVWMIRSWTSTGNPVYPYLSTALGGRDLPQEEVWIATRTGPGSVVTSRSDPLRTPGQFFNYRHPLAFLASPWTLSVDNERYRGLPGPIFLGMLPAVLLWSRRLSPDVKFMLLLIPFLYVGWFFSFSLLRNAVPILALLSVPTAIVFVDMIREIGRARWLMIGVLGIWLAVSLGSSVLDVRHSAPVVFGRTSEDEWLEQRLSMDDRGFDAYPAYRFMNSQLPEDSKVLLWESRGFYLDRPYLRVWEFMYGLADATQLQSGEGALNELRRWGITHVAMTAESKRLWLREILESTGKLDCVYEDDAMTVCAVPQVSEALSEAFADQGFDPLERR